MHSQLSAVLSHSLAAARLTSAFDLGTLLDATQRLSQNAPSSGPANYLGIPLYFIGHFILIPGTLFTYQCPAPARLGTLVSTGLALFWRFVRITLLTAIVSLLILGPLVRLQAELADHIDNHHVGRQAFFLNLFFPIFILLVAALLRLYFDLVEVYTVQLSSHLRPDGTPDRRVRRTLLPAFRTLRDHHHRAYFGFVALALLGFAALALTGRIALHMLAQPRVWPMFLLAQTGLFLMLFTRFWQRGAETILALDNPLPAHALSPGIATYTATGTSSPLPPAHNPADPQPDPEPAVPFLPAPDPGVFHHETEKRDD